MGMFSLCPRNEHEYASTVISFGLVSQRMGDVYIYPFQHWSVFYNGYAPVLGRNGDLRHNVYATFYLDNNCLPVVIRATDMACGMADGDSLVCDSRPGVSPYCHNNLEEELSKAIPLPIYWRDNDIRS